MNSSELVSEGKRRCSELEAINKGDYLTGKIINEVSGIINEIESLNIDNRISDIDYKVAVRRREIEEAEAQALAEAQETETQASEEAGIGEESTE